MYFYSNRITSTTPNAVGMRVCFNSPPGKPRTRASATVYGTFTGFVNTPTIVGNARSDIKVVSVVETTLWYSAVTRVMLIDVPIVVGL